MSLLSRFTTAALCLSLVGPAVAACASIGEAETDGDDPASQSESDIAVTLADTNAPLVVKDPKTLIELEAEGLALASLLGVKGTSTRDLLASSRYAAIVATVEADLQELREADPESGAGIEHRHRQFDPGALRSPQSRFELVGVVNRVDRKHVGGCGELRLVYRLAYTAPRSASRLPMTVNVVFPQADDRDGCSTVARRWLGAKNGSASALLAGPLARRAPLAAIEINVQAVRWPSNERTDLGGHAEYILRAFRPEGDSVEPAPLENTPRPDLGAAERDELQGWIGSHLREIDEGTALLPAKFLAKRAISVSPHGLARAANRPYTRIFEDPDAAFAELPLAGTKQIQSVTALMRRLDTMSCGGCHQARGIAGFHLLGEERDNRARLNALAIGRSPHFNDEVVWRTAFLAAIAEKKPFAPPRPLAEHAGAGGRFGDHCGLGDPGFRGWTCGAGLTCMDLDGDVVGVCAKANGSVGDACEAARMTQNPDPHSDRMIGRRTLECSGDGRGARCNPQSMGFPGGMCRVDCTEADLGTITGETICGAIPSATGLTECLAQRRPFQECLATTSNPAFVRTCDETELCRDDYACMRVPNGPPGIGSCMPPYFAFQARVDGHLFDDAR